MRQPLNFPVTLANGDVTSATVTILHSVTQMPATIYEDAVGTPKDNPFEVGVTGVALCYVDDGLYDAKVEKAGLPDGYKRGMRVVTPERFMERASNGADIANVEVFRDTIEVLSAAEVAAEIADAVTEAVAELGTASSLNFSTSGALGTSDVLLPTQKAVKEAIDSAVTGLWDDRGNYDASTNLFPAAGGSGAAGAVKKGDAWTVAVAGTLGGSLVEPGDFVRALVDAPGQTAGNWAIGQTNLGYTPLNAAQNLADVDDVGEARGNLDVPSTGEVTAEIADAVEAVEGDLGTAAALDFSTSSALGTSDVLVPTQKAVKEAIEAAVTGLWDDRGSYDASGNTFPATGGSGTAGAIRKGDIWTISVGGDLGDFAANAGDTVRALTDAPGQTQENWTVAEGNLGYTPVGGPNSSEDGNLPAFGGTTGKQLTDSGIKTDSGGYLYNYKLKRRNVNSGATDTITAADMGKRVTYDVAGAMTITVSNALPTDFFCLWGTNGLGQLTFVMEAGGTLNNRQGHTKSAGRWANGGLYCESNDGPPGSTAVVTLTGDTAS